MVVTGLDKRCRFSPRNKSLVADDRGDQKSADDEKYIDADKAAFKAGNPRVKKHHRENRYSAQPIDLGAVF